MKTLYVCLEVGTGFLNIVQMSIGLQIFDDVKFAESETTAGSHICNADMS
jgi:hypothetical protein